MDTTYDKTLHYLYALQHRGIKFGLQNTRQLLRYLGNPQRRFSSIHIAGTNGKGSTSAFLASIAMESGLKTGLYTSPHLVRFTERIRINGAELSEERLVYYVKDLRRAIDSVHATFFEATTCVAFQYFADEHVDLAVVETGLGGRFDATNVILPLCSVITSIGLEHTQYLGSTLEQIAAEKGGIIKRRTPVVTGVCEPGPLAVLKQIARRRHAPFYHASMSAACRDTVIAGRHRLLFSTGLLHGRSAELGLPGGYQSRNAQAAVAAYSAMAHHGRIEPPSAEAVRRGLLRVQKNTGLRGRLERAQYRGTPYLLDVGHNPDGIRTLVDALLQEGTAPRVVVFGAMADKDYVAMLEELRRLPVDILIAVAPRTARALPLRELERRGANAGFKTEAAPSVSAGVRRARLLAGRGLVLVAGSHFVVGEALELLETNP